MPIPIPRQPKLLAHIIIPSHSLISRPTRAMEFISCKSTRGSNVALVEARGWVAGAAGGGFRSTDVEGFPGCAEGTVDLADCIVVSLCGGEGRVDLALLRRMEDVTGAVVHNGFTIVRAVGTVERTRLRVIVMPVCTARV